MTNLKKTWFGNWRYNFLKEKYGKKMLHYKKLAEYNLYRHNESVEYYAHKKANRSSGATETNQNMGFYIGDEYADVYAKKYNEYWEEYLRYRNKLQILICNLDEEIKSILQTSAE